MSLFSKHMRSSPSPPVIVGDDDAGTGDDDTDGGTGDDDDSGLALVEFCEINDVTDFILALAGLVCCCCCCCCCWCCCCCCCCCC